MKEDLPALKANFEYLGEYLDRLTNGGDDENTLEGFYKEKLDEVCAQISALQGNENTFEKEDKLKMLELKKSALEDTLSELSNNKENQESSHAGIGSNATEMLVKTTETTENLIEQILQGGIGGKKK